jgi:predicted O-linked N-acetylglucosamine transferase (SPINDLY family)
MNSGEDIKLQRAVALHSRGEAAQAAALYAEILEFHPEHPDVLHLMGVSETQLGRPKAGLVWIAKSLAINPHQPVAITNRGNALLTLDQPAEALSAYDQALRLWRDYPLALYGRGNALSALGRPGEALGSYERTLELSPNFVEAIIARGRALLKLTRCTDALAAFDRALELSPGLAQAHLGRASALLGLKEYASGLRSVDRALQLRPDLAEGFLERGHLLGELGRTDASIAAYDDALRLNSNLAAAWLSRGLALTLRARFGEAAASLRQASQIDPAQPYAAGAGLHAQLQICDWTDHADRVREVTASVPLGKRVDFPFSFLAICDSPPLQLECAKAFAELQRTGQRPLWTGEQYRHERVRIAYISADFLDHPTSYLMAGLFESHDRRRFETIAISLREDEASPTARRVKAAFERYIAVQSQPDHDIARLIRDLEIDIAVDLMGYTGEHRAGIFTHRPAPIQVNYLGFPATTGSGDMDYLIADRFLIPEEYRSGYSEHIVYLPESFQANDDHRPLAAETPTRAQMGLPDAGFVWCSFHAGYKLNPTLFDVWARLLLAEPDSVLWLVGGSPIAVANLRREALARGVAAERLVFAESLPYPRHLARLRLADLCLDTYPFNGGTTASDALWAGVPVVTCAGRSFAARMAGSLLHAVGLPGLVTQSLEEYEQLALRLARAPDRLAEVRATLAHQRQASPLFDTDRFRRHIESAYLAMVERRRSGLAPATLTIPAISRGGSQERGGS